MSSAPTDLDALRAAALMSRKQLAQTVSLAQTSLDLQAQVLPASLAIASTSTPSSPVFDNSDVIPGLEWVQTAAKPSETTDPTTCTSGYAPFSRTAVASRPNEASDSPATSVLIAAQEAADREDGEISDDDTAKRLTNTSVSATNQMPKSSTSPQIKAEDITTSQHGPTWTSLNPSVDRHSGYTQRPKSTANKPPPSTHRAAFKSKTRSLDSGMAWVEQQDQDFTKLMAEYQLQKARDNKPQTATGTQEQSSLSDIPGLGQIKNQGRSFMGPSASERYPRFPSHGPYNNDVSRPHPHPSPRLRKPRSSRDPGMPYNDYPSESQSAPYTPHPSSRYQPDARHDTSTPNPTYSNSLPQEFGVNPTPDQDDKSQIYSLVNQLMDHGVSPDYLLQMGIDSTAVNLVARQRASRLLATTSIDQQYAQIHPVILGAAADTSVPVHYLHQPTGIAGPQQMPEQPVHIPTQLDRTTYPAQDVLGGFQTSWSALSQMKLFLEHQQQQARQQAQQQQILQSLSSLHEVPAAASALLSDNDLAAKQLEMIVTLAAQVLPKGWDTLLQNSSTAEEDPSPPLADAAAAEQRNDVVPSGDFRVEQDPNSAQLTSRGQGVNGISQNHDPHTSWNHGVEAKYTTEKFQDLSISPPSSVSVAPQVVKPTPEEHLHPSNLKNDEDSTPPMAKESAVSSSVSDTTVIPATQPTETPHRPVTLPAQHRQSPFIQPPPPPPPPTPPYVPPAPPPPPPIAHSSLSSTPEPDGADKGSSMETATPTITNIGDQTAANVEALHDLHIDSVPSRSDSPDNGAQDDANISLDDMDMDLDDDDTQTTILKGSWKTTEDALTESSESSSQSDSKKRSPAPPSSIVSPVLMQINSAPASIATTPIRQDNADLLPTQIPQRHQWNGRRATALDFIPKTRQQTPFVQERVLSYLIDLDDEDGDEPGGDTFRETFTLERASAPRGRMTEPAKKSAESQSLLNIQRKMKELNDLIKIKELARQSSNSAKNTGLKKTHSSTMSQSAASSPIVNSPAMDSPVPSPGKLPQTADQSPKPAAEIKPDSAVNDDASQLRRSLGDDTVSLEQLRSLLQECEKETSAASSILENMASVKKDDKQVLDALQKAFAQAQETVNAKEQELAEAKLQLEEIRARVESTTTRLTDTDRTRDKLQKRIQQGQEKSTRLKSSIGLLQQDIIRKRTRLMIIESGSAAAGDMVPIGNTQAQAKPESVGSKRDVNTQDGHSSHVAPKKPRIQAREEMNALAKRMQELSRERALLQSGVLTPVPPTATTSGSTSRPSSASSNSNPAILSSLASSKHARTPSQQGPLKPPTPAPAINSTPARAGHKPSATPADLSRLDEFLSQTKNLPINRMVDRAAPTSLSSWRVAPSIKKLFWEAGCLFDLDQLCLPSELIQYAIPNHQTETPAAPSSTQTKSDGTPAGTGASLDYKSLLPMFRSYRFSPRYRDTVRDGYRSLTYSHKIDPSKPICIYELSGGSCNDDSCKSQHLRDCIPTDEELIIDMARYSEGNTPEARRAFAEMQSARLAHLRAAGIHHADLLVDSIVRNHQEFVRDSSRVVKFENRIALDNSQAEDRTVRDERKTSGRNRAVDHAMFASKSEPDPFDHNAIVMSIIAKASEGTPNKNRRYHEHRTSEYYQKQLGIDPSNEALWIQYAVFLLTEVDVEDSHVGKAMHALASGLSANPRSESLWSAYLDLCVRNGAEVETREMFEECLLYIPDAQLVWFRYYIWEKERDKRVYVLDRMLERACQHPREGDDTSTRSRFALDVVLQIVKMMVSEDFVESAKNWLQNFLTCASWDSIVPSSLSYAQMDDVWVDQDMVDNVAGTFAAKVLTPTDHCVLWLAYVYLIWFHELPEQLFLDHPNNYLSDNRLFAIQWPRTDEPDQESELFNIVHEIFLGLTSYFVDSEARPPLVAIVKNFVEFLMARGQQQSEILELVSPSQFPELLPEIGDLFCQVQMRFNQYEEARRDLEQVIQESPTQPYLWNRYARLLPVEGKIACLEQCVIEFFILKPSDETSTHRSELALLLYKKLLGLGLPYSYVAPTPRLDIAPFKTNTFLWMNYLSLLALHSRRDNSFIQLETGFSVAQELVPMDKSFAVQTEFAVHSIMKELDKYQNGALHSTIVSAVGGISVTKANPYDHSTMEDTNALSLRDFSRLNRVVESIWNQTAEGPQELRVEIMDVFLRLYPENPELYFWMGEAEELAGHAKQCRKIAVACLKRFPLSESVWKRMMQMLTGSMSQESMEVIMKASLLSPLAARMSKMPLLQAAEKRIKGFQPNKAEPPPPQQQQQQDAGVTEGHMSDIQDQESDSDVDMVN